MGDTFVCDVCDERIEKGYSVAWCPDLEDNAHGVAWDHNVTTRNLCHDCWPEDTSLRGRVRRLLGRLGLPTTE